jgi:hypothetical protein
MGQDAHDDEGVGEGMSNRAKWFPNSETLLGEAHIKRNKKLHCGHAQGNDAP